MDISNARCVTVITSAVNILASYKYMREEQNWSKALMQFIQKNKHK